MPPRSAPDKIKSQDALSEEFEEALLRVTVLAQDQNPLDKHFLSMAIEFLKNTCRADPREETTVGAVYRLAKMEAPFPNKRTIVWNLLQKFHPSEKSFTYLDMCLENTLTRAKSFVELEKKWLEYYHENQKDLNSFETFTGLWRKFIAHQAALLRALGIANNQISQDDFNKISHRFWKQLGVSGNSLDELLAFAEAVYAQPAEEALPRIMQWADPEAYATSIAPPPAAERTKAALTTAEVVDAIKAAALRNLPSGPSPSQVSQAVESVKQEVRRYFETSQAPDLKAQFSTELMRSDRVAVTKLNVDLLAKKAWIREKLPRLHDEIEQVFTEVFPTNPVASQEIAEIKLYTYDAVRGFIYGALRGGENPTLSDNYQDYVYRRIVEKIDQGRGTQTPTGQRVALVHAKIKELVENIYQRSQKKTALSKALSDSGKNASSNY